MARDPGTPGKPLLDELGVKPGMRISVLDIPEPGFLAQLHERTDDLSTRRRARCDLLFVRFEERAQLGRLHAHRAFIVPEGAIWAVWPKGRPELTENHVRDAALEAG